MIKKEGILLILLIAITFCFCGAVTAHPGHGTPIEVPTDPGTGAGTDTGTTDTGSTGSTSSGTDSGATSTYGGS